MHLPRRRPGVGAPLIQTTHRKFGLSIIQQRNKSSYENEIAAWLRTLNVQFRRNDRTILRPKELDFYLPECKLAIEFQGDYWHMNPALFDKKEINRSKNMSALAIWERDQWKVEMCAVKGIEVIQIWEANWNSHKADIQKEIISRISLQAPLITYPILIQK